MTPLEAYNQILKPLRRGNAVRHIWLGDSGAGKTTANRGLIEYALSEGLFDVVLTHDEKDPYRAQYAGYECINPEDFLHNPPGEMPTHIVFRGVAKTRRPDHGCKPDDIAQMAWQLIRETPCSVALNLDEFHDCLIPNSQLFDGRAIGAAYRKGRQVGITLISGIQQPQVVPREAIGLATTYGIFRLGPADAEYLRKKRLISNSACDIVPRLPIGSYILSVKGSGKEILIKGHLNMEREPSEDEESSEGNEITEVPQTEETTNENNGPNQ